MIRHLYRVLTSLRLTLVLIFCLSGIFLLGLWIPQKSLLNRELYLTWKAGSPRLVSLLEFLGFTDIYSAPLTVCLWTLFFINLAFVMWQRISVVKKKIAIPEGLWEQSSLLSGYPWKTTIELPEGSTLEMLPKSINKIGYAFFGAPQRFLAVKNRYSPIATLLFHLSFFLILLGGVVTSYTRFAATIDLAEGETFRGELDRYNAVPRLPKIGTVPKVDLVVQGIAPESQQDTPTGLKITIDDSLGNRHVAEVNRPYKTDNTSFVIRDIGVAPLIIIFDDIGRELDGAYVKLNVLQGKQDVFTMAGMEFTVDYFPDYVLQDGVERTRSWEMKNPAFLLYIQKNRQFIAKRTVRPGETIRFGEYQLSIMEVPYWVRFYVVKESGVGIVYAGFLLASIALVWKLLFFRRELAGEIKTEAGKRVLTIAGRAEFYKLLFQDEFDSLIRKIESSFMNREN